MANTKVNYERICVSLDRKLVAEIRQSYPHREFSGLINQLLDYAHAAGFLRRLSDIAPQQGSQFGDVPVVNANAAQLEFARHAFHYMCRITAETAEEDMRQYLIAVREQIDTEEMTVTDFDALVNLAVESGWNKTSQDEAPIPKMGSPRKKPTRKPTKEVVAPEATIEEVEAFGEEVEVFGA